MRFASLGSGSEGNALVVSSGGTCLLLDCGLSVRETERRLARLGLVPADLSAVLVTHEHEDHIGGVLALSERHALPIHLTHGTCRAAGWSGDVLGCVQIIDSHTAFSVGDLLVEPMPVPHDAREPVQYVFSDGARRLGVLTDTGQSTPHLLKTLSGCDGLVLECNHDPDLLQRGPYPGWLKARIAGSLGHLSNQQAAELLGGLDRSRLQHLVAAHLSTRNNTPALARAALAGAAGCKPDWVGVASQKTGFDWRQLHG
jgi:phosphoribosyl 1,2-cyclic phosphodiesterase